MVKISLDPIKGLLSWFNPPSVYNYDTDIIHLTKYAKEKVIEQILSHETIHRTICILEGKKTSRALDYLEGIEI